MNLKNRLLLIVLLIAVLITAIFFVLKFTGFAINSPSSVTIESRIIVNSSLFDGSTTDFSNMNNNQLRNITEMILEKTEYGKIIFQKSVDLTQNSKNGVVDVDNNVNISNNKIEINTDELTSLENPAVLYLYNLSFNNPRIMRNGGVCSDSICQKINYSSGTLVFSVTGFTAYRAEETPKITETPSTGTGGGGGGAVLIRNFSVDRDLIKVSIKQGENAKEFLVIKNTGNTEMNISLEISKLEKFLILSDEEFVLKTGESKTIGIDLFAKEKEVADSYLGKIIISEAGIKKTVSVILEIKERNPLFDIKTEILNKVVRPREKVRTNITIINKGDLKHIDVILYTAIKNLDGDIIDYKDESLAVEKELSITKSMDVPELVDGKYIFYSRVSYGNISASSSEVFEVSSVEVPKVVEMDKNIILIVVALVVIIIVIWVVYLKKQMKLKKGHLKKRMIKFSKTN